MAYLHHFWSCPVAQPLQPPQLLITHTQVHEQLQEVVQTVDESVTTDHVQWLVHGMEVAGRHPAVYSVLQALEVRGGGQKP